MDIDNELSRPVSHNSLRFPMGINHELSRPISYRFWKALFWVFIWTLTRSSPDQIPIDFERNALRRPYGNWPWALQIHFLQILKGTLLDFDMGIDQELSRQISYRFWEKLLKFSIWVLAMSSPEHFFTYFAMNLSRFPYGNWPGAALIKSFPN